MRDDRMREEIRSRVDIVDVVSSYLTLKRSGGSYKGLCPFHDEKTPSFHVSPKIQRYHCFGCQAGGDVFKFVMEIEKLTFPEAMSRLAERAGIRYEPVRLSPEAISERDRLRALMHEAAAFYHERLLRGVDAKHARKYLGERGLRSDIVERFQLGYAPDSWDATHLFLVQRGYKEAEVVKSGMAIEREGGRGSYDRFRNRVMFPIHDGQGHVIAFGGRTLSADDAKYINSNETPLFTKGQTLYGIALASSAIRERDQILICEGYMDLIALHQYGFENSVATLGTAVSPAHVQSLRRWSRNLVAAFDGDSAGMAAVLRMAPMFEQQEVELRVLRLPQGDDPDTFLRKHGAEAFSQQVNQSLPLIDYRIDAAKARYSENDEGSLPAMIKDVIPILLEIRRPIVLDAQVVRVAQLWAHGDLVRARSIEAAIKQELTLAKRRVSSDRSNRSDTSEEVTPNALTSRAVPGVVKSERQLLSIALRRLDVARKVLHDDVAPEEFVDPLNRELAMRVYEVAVSSNANEIDEQWARTIVEELGQNDPDAAAVVTQMFMDDHPVDDRQIAKVVQAVKDRHGRRKRTSLSRDRLYGCASSGMR